MHVILQTGLDDHAGLAAQGVPNIWKYVKDDESRRVLELILGQQVFGRPFKLPPGVPAERVAILRKAFDDTMADKAFVADAEKMGLEITPASGARVQERGGEDVRLAAEHREAGAGGAAAVSREPVQLCACVQVVNPPAPCAPWRRWRSGSA